MIVNNGSRVILCLLTLKCLNTKRLHLLDVLLQGCEVAHRLVAMFEASKLVEI